MLAVRVSLAQNGITYPGADAAVTGPDGGQFRNSELELEEAAMAIPTIFLELIIALHAVDGASSKPDCVPESRGMPSRSIYGLAAKGTILKLSEKVLGDGWLKGATREGKISAP